MLRKLLLASTVVMTMGIASSPDASAQAPAAFGPIQSRSFAWKAGTNVETTPASGCQSNVDWLVLKGPGLANAKQVDIAPKTHAWDKQVTIPVANTCAQGDPNCFQVYVKLSKDAPGPRTVTVKHADGRTLTTTFNVVANAGRCDFPTGAGK